MVRHAAPRLLVVEDDPDTADLMLEALADYFGCACATHCKSFKQVIEQDVQQVDLVLSDINLPDGTGLALLEHLLRQRPELPVVMVTGVNIVDVAATAIARGAYDYVVKAGDYLLTIPLVVEKNLALWRMRQDNRRLQAELQQSLEQVRVKNEQLEQVVAQLKQAAATDPLTGLANRRALAGALERDFAEARRRGHDLSCLMIDLDAFKQFNDLLGHQAGDRLLVSAAGVLEANSRRADMAGRYGGDEMVLLLPRTDEAEARQVAERVREQFAQAGQAFIHEQMADADQPRPTVTMSIGMASLGGSAATMPEQLIGFADHALYQAKVAGKERLVVYRPPDLRLLGGPRSRA